MCELPSKEPLFEIMVRDDKAGEAIDLRREKWCRQLVQGVAEVNSKLFMVGLLCTTIRNRVGIGSNDDAVLYDCFRKRFRDDKANIWVPRNAVGL